MSLVTYHLIETAVVTTGVGLALATAARMAWQRLQPKGKRAGGSNCAPACGGGACAGCGSDGAALPAQPQQATVMWHPRETKRRV